MAFDARPPGLPPHAAAQDERVALRLRAHAAIAPTVVLVSMVVAGLLVWAMGAPVAPPAQRIGSAWTAWLAALAAVLALRLGLCWWHRRAPLVPSRQPAWLAGYRAAILLHGAVWGAVGTWLPSMADAQQQAVLLIVLTGLAAGAMALTLFDLIAGWLFAIPLLLPLLWRLTAEPQSLPIASRVALAMAALLLAVLSLAARRGDRTRRAGAAERENQADRRAADAARHQAAQAQLAHLQEQQGLLALVMAATEQGFWYIDNALRTTDANPAMCRMLRCPREQLLGRSIYDFVDAANARIFRQQVLLRTSGQAEGYEIALLRTDGSLVHCYNNATPVVDGQGRKTGALGLFSDISAQKHAEQALRQSETRFRTLADAAPALIWWSGGDGVAAWFNQRWIDYTGLGLAGLLAGHWTDHLHPQDQARCRSAYRQALAQRRPYALEFRLRRADGSWGWIADQGIPRRAADGGFEGCISYGWEITERKAAEAALIGARDEAERARAQAEQANRAKSDFLSRMSHELRTPMNAILGFGQLLAADADDPLSPGQQQRVQALLHGGRHLLLLIDEVLDIARIEAGRRPLALAPVGVATLALRPEPGLLSPPGRRQQVLYIEDNEVNQLLMQGMLSHRPMIDLRLAGLPEQGLAMAAAQPPDLVLLDIQLPGIDGYEVLRRLRLMPGLAATPVLAVSANAMPEDLAQARRAGFADYLTKPVDLARLLALVDRALDAAAAVGGQAADQAADQAGW